MREAVLTVNQLQRLSNIFDNAGQVVLAVMVLGPMFSPLNIFSVFMVILGLVTIFVCLMLSVWLARRAE